MTRQRELLRLAFGMALLEEWTEGANQSQKNALHRVLFAVADGSVRRTHVVLDDVGSIGRFFVLARPDLVVSICFPSPTTFGVLFIGEPAGSPLTAPLDEEP